MAKSKNQEIPATGIEKAKNEKNAIHYQFEKERNRVAAYDALEKGSFSQEELGPRIRKLQSRKNELESARQQMNCSIQSKLDEAPDVEKIE